MPIERIEDASPSAVYLRLQFVAIDADRHGVHAQEKTFPGATVCGVSVTCACSGSANAASKLSPTRIRFIELGAFVEAMSVFQTNQFRRIKKMNRMMAIQRKHFLILPIRFILSKKQNFRSSPSARTLRPRWSQSFARLVFA